MVGSVTQGIADKSCAQRFEILRTNQCSCALSPFFSFIDEEFRGKKLEVLGIPTSRKENLVDLQVTGVVPLFCSDSKDRLASKVIPRLHRSVLSIFDPNPYNFHRGTARKQET